MRGGYLVKKSIAVRVMLFVIGALLAIFVFGYDHAESTRTVCDFSTQVGATEFYRIVTNGGVVLETDKETLSRLRKGVTYHFAYGRIFWEEYSTLSTHGGYKPLPPDQWRPQDC